MIVDCHVHVSAFVDGNGTMSPRLLGSLPFRFMRWRLGLPGADAATERLVAERLVATVAGTPELDAAVVLAFDAVYAPDGTPDPAQTHLYVSNDYVARLAAAQPKLLFGASVHPYRRDAVREIERCVAAGAVLLKWLPITQGFDPSDPRCIPVYEALAHHRLPLLCHTGWERTLPTVNGCADPMLLEPALRRGVTVIAAHCGTRSAPGESCHVERFLRLVREHEHCYGDTSALNLPTRWYAWERLLADDGVRAKLVHGSDWPIIALPRPRLLGVGASLRLLREGNWMRRDVLIKRRLGLDDAYWRRAASLLRLPARAPTPA